MSPDAPGPARIVVLAAIDETAASEDVLTTSATLGQTMPGTELHLLHVVKPVTDVDAAGAVHTSLTECIESARTLMDTTAARARERFFGRIVPHVTTGVPWQAILQVASDLHADLIVVGSHGRKGFQRWALGSVSEQIVRKASCAVLVARPKDYRDAVPEVEPPCVDCLATQKNTSGDQLWCSRHDRANKHPHARMHYQMPQSFAVGSLLIRPEG